MRGLDRFQYFPVNPEAPEFLDCRINPPADFGGPLIGRAVVFDAQPVRAQRPIRHAGFSGSGFPNQGQCIKAVNHR